MILVSRSKTYNSSKGYGIKIIKQNYKMKICIVISNYNKDITDGILKCKRIRKI